MQPAIKPHSQGQKFGSRCKQAKLVLAQNGPEGGWTKVPKMSSIRLLLFPNQKFGQRMIDRMWERTDLSRSLVKQ